MSSSVFMLLSVLSTLSNTSFDPTTEMTAVYIDQSEMCFPVMETTTVTTFDPCEMCVETVEELQAVLQDEQVREQVVYTVELLCRALGPHMDEMCEAIVEFYLPQLIENFLSRDSHEVCHSMHLC